VTSARHYSYAEYLATLAETHLKLEYYEGCIYAMAGGTREHAALSVAIASLLRDALKGACTVLSSDAKIFVEATGLATFPDVSVLCAPPKDAAIDPNATTNPTLLVEVTSPSTEDYDRGEKTSHYKQIPSLRAILFVSHREKRVTVVEREGSGWRETEVRSAEVVRLDSPACAIPVDSVYEGIDIAR
jgi:Uma2 family endonuclease